MDIGEVPVPCIPETRYPRIGTHRATLPEEHAVGHGDRIADCHVQTLFGGNPPGVGQPVQTVLVRTPIVALYVVQRSVGHHMIP